MPAKTTLPEPHDLVIKADRFFDVAKDKDKVSKQRLEALAELKQLQKGSPLDDELLDRVYGGLVGMLNFSVGEGVGGEMVLTDDIDVVTVVVENLRSLVVDYPYGKEKPFTVEKQKYEQLDNVCEGRGDDDKSTLLRRTLKRARTAVMVSEYQQEDTRRLIRTFTNQDEDPLNRHIAGHVMETLLTTLRFDGKIKSSFFRDQVWNAYTTVIQNAIEPHIEDGRKVALSLNEDTEVMTHCLFGLTWMLPTFFHEPRRMKKDRILTSYPTAHLKRILGEQESIIFPGKSPQEVDMIRRLSQDLLQGIVEVQKEGSARQFKELPPQEVLKKVKEAHAATRGTGVDGAYNAMDSDGTMDGKKREVQEGPTGVAKKLLKPDLLEDPDIDKGLARFIARTLRKN